MKIFVIILLIAFTTIGCKHQNSEQVKSSASDYVILIDSIEVSKDPSLPSPPARNVKVYCDSSLTFKGIESIFEDEFYLLFENAKGKKIRFYCVAGSKKLEDNPFLIESEGFFIANPKMEEKQFIIKYKSIMQENFVGEVEHTSEIISIHMLFDTIENIPDKVIEKLDQKIIMLKSYLQNIDWEKATRNDSCTILYEDDFMYRHNVLLRKDFIGFNDCSGDSVFKSYYADRTVHVEGTEPVIYWACDFVLPSLNLRVNNKKEDIIAKLGLPGYDFDSILVYPKYVPDAITEMENGKKYDDTVFFIFEDNKLIGIIATFYFI